MVSFLTTNGVHIVHGKYKLLVYDFPNFYTKKRSAKTVQNIVGRVKVMTNKLLDRELIKHNPFLKLTMPKVVETEKNSSFSPDHIKQLKEYTLKHEPFMWLVFQFIYYTYMRPVEIGRLKVGHIDLTGDKIHVTGDISKNRKNQTIELPSPLKKELVKYINTAPKDYFLFTAELCPGQNKISDSFFGKHFLKIREALGFDDKHTLYSWKHTGVIQAYKNGVDIKAIQLQCRHHSINQKKF